MPTALRRNDNIEEGCDAGSVSAEAKLKAEVEARAKLEAERKAAEAAKLAEDEAKKVDKLYTEKVLEETTGKIEDQKKMAEKALIKFTDAIGRKFSFPFHLCQTWTVCGIPGCVVASADGFH
jgi:DNA-directed RNA polymerase alpha subunit